MRNQAGVGDGGSPFSYYPRQIRTPRVLGPSGRFKPATFDAQMYTCPQRVPQRGRKVHQKKPGPFLASRFAVARRGFANNARISLNVLLQWHGSTCRGATTKGPL